MTATASATRHTVESPPADRPGQGWVRRLGSYVLRHRRDVVIAVSAAILGSGCQTVVPLLERQIVDHVIVTQTSALWPWLALLLALAAASFAFAYLRRYRGGRVALSVQYDLRNDMQAHLQRMDFASLGGMPTGQLVARANSDSALAQGFLSFLPIMGGNLLLMLLSLIVMLFLSPLLALVSLVVAPALLIVSYRMRKRIFPATWDAQQREGDLVQMVDEDVNGVRVVKAFGRESHEVKRMADVAGTLYGAQMRATRLQARYQPMLQAIPSLAQVAILALGGWLALRNDLTLGTFLAFSTYVAQLMAPARQLAGLLSMGQQARAGIDRIFQLLDLKPRIVDPPDAVDLTDVDGSVTFQDVRFGYDVSEVLNDFNLHIAAGERVAIVGPSGSGKSTATLLIPRFYDPDSGSVLIDGHDVRTVTLHSLRSSVGVAFEDSFLFSDTIRANIAYGRPDATDEQISTAARIAMADQFITDLPGGYDTVVGERGLTLSGGQRQRVALARAILSDPRVLILDDATSAVDAATEESINEALRRVMADRTTILVAHRRSTLHLADRIVVIDGGRVIDEGDHDTLMARSDLYRRLLTGLGDDPEADLDNIEQLSAYAGHGGRTDAAWRGTTASPPRRRNGVSIGPPSLGSGLGRTGRSSWRANLAPTPELLKQVAALRPIRDRVDIDLAAESRHQPGFTLPKLLREFRRPLLIALVLVVLDAVASLAGPVLVKTGIDDGVAVHAGGVLAIACGLFLLVTVADLVIQVGQTFLSGRVAQRVMLSLRIRIWAQLQRLSLSYYEREMAGRIMTRMTTDVDQFESLIENGLLSALVSFVTFAGVGVALVVFDVELGLITLSVVIPLAIATVIFRHRASRLYDVARERIAIVNADFQESLSGVRESQAFVHETVAMRRFRGLGRRYLDTRLAAQRLVATYFPFVQFLSAAADAIVLSVGAILIHEGRLTAGALIAFILYIDLFFSPIQQLSQVFDSWQQTRISVGRISELMRLETGTPQPAEPVILDHPDGALALRDLHFAYPTATGERDQGRRGPADAPDLNVGTTTTRYEAIRGIELSIASGETVALVGETGAGKTTVVKLLARFYDPDTGSVRLDDHDLRTLDLAAYRRRLGYVPQESFLFTGTVRDNIAYGRPTASDLEIEAATRAVGAHDFVAALPGGYLHEIAERGRSLSSGQRQLIALARAELVDPRILLLDEATSNLDLVTEARVTDAMQRLARNRTTIVIAHRLQTARHADRIVVLDHGTIVEAGSHEDLLASGGQYARMWQAFASLSSG